MANEIKKPNYGWTKEQEEALVGPEIKPYEKTTSQKIGEALAALGGMAGSASNIINRSYGHGDMVSSPFSTYNDLVTKAGQEQAATISAQDKRQQRLEGWQKWLPGEARASYEFERKYGPGGEAELDKKRREIEDAMKAREAKAKEEKEKSPVYFAKEEEFKNIIESTNPKVTPEMKKNATEGLRRLQEKGEFITQSSGWFTPEESMKVDVPFTKRLESINSSAAATTQTAPSKFQDFMSKFKKQETQTSTSSPAQSMSLSNKATQQTVDMQAPDGTIVRGIPVSDIEKAKARGLRQMDR